MHILVLKTWHFRLWFCEWYIYYQACLFTCTSYGSTFRSSCVPLQSWMDGVWIIWILSPLQNTNSLTNMFYCKKRFKLKRVNIQETLYFKLKKEQPCKICIICSKTNMLKYFPISLTNFFLCNQVTDTHWQVIYL